MKKLALKTILRALPFVLTRAAKRNAVIATELRRRDCILEIGLKDGSIVRHFIFKGGRVRSVAGRHPRPDVRFTFKYLSTALEFLKPRPNPAEVIHATKNFHVDVAGDSETIVWFSQMMNSLQTVTLKHGRAMPDGTHRYTSNSNGGPFYVYVKEGRIVRTSPIDLQATDAESWSITARGKTFRPDRRAYVTPFALAMKSMVYSKKRALYPMIREDFDPTGERNTHRRGLSGYRRISWDEALDIVATEMKRQKREHGPGAMALHHSSHHQWGNVGYYLSSLMRFGNLVGCTRIHHNPDSWEGWYWGAQHHYGNSLRVGVPGSYGTVEDCLKEAEMIVFWSSDPESTSGAYSGGEGMQRRLWAKDLGIEFVHIDPHMTQTNQLIGGKWLPIRPGTDSALALAIMYVWVTEGLYDQDYVARRTTGFEAWKAYLLGDDDGQPKTPEWQEPETGLPARTVRALARTWGRRKVYLAAGGLGHGLGGACRSANGTQWARNMILLMAMQGWGKPGVNFGNLQAGTPVDLTFYFPGYSEGGISGELNATAAAINNYNRMPHVLTMNPVKQMIPRQRLAEAIIEGKAEGHLWDGSSLEAQFVPFSYPMPGHSPIHMLYRYGGSSFGTIANSNRLVEAYRHPSLEFVVSQSIWTEGEAQFADIILPACTALERWDIGEWSGAGGYGLHWQNGLNHRMVVMQHKCIEPLGESKSDYQIFLDLLHRFGLGAAFSEGCSELDWCRRIFDSSDLPRHITWEKFVEKGYFVIPADPEAARDPVEFRWYAEGRHKDTPEPHPLPAQFSDEFRKGLQTPSGKIEFVSETLRRFDPDNPERPALNKYIPSWEGLRTKDLVDEWPLQLIAAHSRYSFHTYGDGKDSHINDIRDHRVRIDGYFYLLLRINPADAEARGIRQHDLLRVFNGRGSVICAADVSQLMGPGIVKAYESSAEFDLVRTGGIEADRGGCLNVLTPARPQVMRTEGMGSNSCLVQIEKWVAPMEAIA